MAKKDPTPKRTTPLMWDDPELVEHHGAIEAQASKMGNVKRNVNRSIRISQKTLDSAPEKAAAGNPLKASTTKGAKDNIQSLKDMQKRGVLHDQPMTIDSMANITSSRFDMSIDDAKRRSAISGKRELPRGSAWYFEHNQDLLGRGEDRLDTSHVSPEITGLMAAAVSPTNTPERERSTTRALVNLQNPKQEHTVNYTKAGIKAVGERTREPFTHPHGTDIPVSNLNPNQLAATASHAAEEGSKISSGKMSKRAQSVTSTGPIAEAGLSNQRQIETAARLGSNDPTADPFEDYDASTSPKTSAHGRMTGKSVPGSLAHLDYLNIAHHVTHEDPNQSMMQFSPEITERTGTLPHALQPKAPVAADTWWQGVMSGQPLADKRVKGQGGFTSSRGYSPAKRIATEGADPVSSRWLSKSKTGAGRGDTSVTPVGIMHAYINEGIHQGAARHGNVSQNQFGEHINLPASLVHETVWTGAREEAGFDKPFNAERDTYNAGVKATANAAKFTANSGIKDTGRVAGTKQADSGAKSDAAKVSKDRAYNETKKGQANPRAIPTGFQDKLF